MSRKRKSYIALMRGVMYVCSGLTAALLLFLLGYPLDENKKQNILKNQRH